MCCHLLNISMLSIVLFASGQPSAPFALTINMKGGETFESGSPVNVQIVLRNTSKGNIVEMRNKPTDAGELNGYTVSLKNKEAEEVPFTEYGKAFFAGTTIDISSPSPVVLKPGDILKDEIVLTKLFELSKPGTYTVQVQRKDLYSPGIGKSNTVSFTITGRKY